MGEKAESKAAPPRIGAAAKADFLAGLRRGESREDAAAAAGFSLMGFYGARRRDPAFGADWTEALATSAAAERRVRAYAERGERAERGEVRIACANRRVYQRRRRRNVRFDAAAQAIYLAHFAAHCDSRAAAEAAGVHESTVELHRRNDPAFAEAHDAPLAEGYRNLEEESVRLRLAAQKRLRAAIEAAGPLRPPGLTAEEGARVRPHHEGPRPLGPQAPPLRHKLQARRPKAAHDLRGRHGAARQEIAGAGAAQPAAAAGRREKGRRAPNKGRGTPSS
jgi:hypothetical protein